MSSSWQTQVSNTVCACAVCNVQTLDFDTPVTIIAYGNSTVSTLDYMGAALDFYPSTVFLHGLSNCTGSFGLLLNGTAEILDMVPFVNCSVALGARDAGNYVFVALVNVHNVTTTVQFVKSPPLPGDNSVATLGANGMSLVLNDLVDCALPATYSYCGESRWTGGGTCGRYAGACVNDNGTVPSGCYGAPLFQFIDLVPPTSILVIVLTALFTCLLASCLTGTLLRVSAFRRPAVARRGEATGGTVKKKPRTIAVLGGGLRRKRGKM